MPRGPAAWKLIALIVIVISSVLMGVMFSSPLKSIAGRTATLLSREDDDRNGEATEPGGGYFTCGMHPWVILPSPGLCPICHMDLTPLDASKLTGEIAIDPVIVQSIGVRIAEVTRGQVTSRIRTVGTVVHDETTTRDISLKTAGWIEKLHVAFIGAPVVAGQPLLEIYSPELYAAQQEYLTAKGGGLLVDNARTKLEFLGITAEQIDELENAGSPQRLMTLTSPYTGNVIEKSVYEGMRVEPGASLYRISDHHRVWVMVSLYEHQLPLVELGQRATMTLPFVPESVFEGKVAYIDPHLDPTTRQLKVRLEFDNPELILKPGMFARVELDRVIERDAVLAPRESVLATGDREIVFVSLGGGRFEPREVRSGLAAPDGRVQILDGLEAGEVVVTSGQFLLDSESKMREALAKMVRGNLASEQSPQVEALESSAAMTLPAAAESAISQLLDAYLAISESLSSNVASGIADPAEVIVSAITALESTPLQGDEHFWHRHADDARTIRIRAGELARGADVDNARIAFGHLSDALDRVLSATGVPEAFDSNIDRLVCGMAKDVPRKGVWLQRADSAIRNPYFGEMMLTCNVPDLRRRMPIAEQGAGGRATEAHEHDAPRDEGNEGGEAP